METIPYSAIGGNSLSKSWKPDCSRELINFLLWFSRTTLRCLMQIHRPKACVFIKKEILAQMFSCEFCENFKIKFFIEQTRWLLLDVLPWILQNFWDHLFTEHLWVTASSSPKYNIAYQNSGKISVKENLYGEWK